MPTPSSAAADRVDPVAKITRNMQIIRTCKRLLEGDYTDGQKYHLVLQDCNSDNRADEVLAFNVDLGNLLATLLVWIDSEPETIWHMCYFGRHDGDGRPLSLTPASYEDERYLAVKLAD